MAAYRRVDDLSSPAGWLPVHRDQFRAQRSVTSMGSLYLFYLLKHKGQGWLKCNHLINAIRSQRYHAFAFLTSPLLKTPSTTTSLSLNCLSSVFGMHGSVLCWFKSYLSSCSFRVKCYSNLCRFIFPLVEYPKALSSALYLLSRTVHYLSQYFWPPPLCRWHSALLLFPHTQLWLEYFLPSKLTDWLFVCLRNTHNTRDKYSNVTEAGCHRGTNAHQWWLRIHLQLKWYNTGTKMHIKHKKKNNSN